MSPCCHAPLRCVRVHDDPEPETGYHENELVWECEACDAIWWEHEVEESQGMTDIEVMEIPARTMQSLRLWVEYATLPGGFLMAVLMNDLREAVCRADDDNLRALPRTVRWLVNEAPDRCWGSGDNVALWKGRIKP